MIKLIIGAIVAVFVVIGGFMMMDPNIQGTQESTEVQEKNLYTIEGEVAKPGTYSLDENITMLDLITAAGGITSNADELAYFENATLSVGNSYYIASKYDASDVCNNQEIVKVNINSDTVEEMKTINGITNTIAESIVSYRTEKGIISTLEELLDVYGIGNATYKKIRNFITLHE
jgi:competence protein ComEA